MGKREHVRTFDEAAYAATVRGMASRREGVHDAGRKVLQQTGALHPFVNVRQNRGSRNAMIPDATDSTKFELANGIALPIVALFDGTGSTSEWLDLFFHAAQQQDALLKGARTRYNTQVATGVVQDVCDPTPVVQLSQFESDHRVAEQVRLLQPASAGGDAPEDYELGLAAGLFLETDFWDHYGMRGYFTLTADEIGRGFVTPDLVREHLGQDLKIQSSRLTTEELCRMLLEKWHVFFLQVPYGGDLLRQTTRWWTHALGSGRVITVPDPRLLAEIRAALVYVTEAQQPNQKGLGEFLNAGVDQSHPLTAQDLDNVWRQVNAAEEHFGMQARHPDYGILPKPGDKFANYRHAWPIGHPREQENVTPTDTLAS